MKQREQLLTSQSQPRSLCTICSTLLSAAAKARAQLPPVCAQMLCPCSGVAKWQHAEILLYVTATISTF